VYAARPGGGIPVLDDLYSIGVVANILQTLRMPDGSMKVVVEGMARGVITQFNEEAISSASM